MFKLYKNAFKTSTEGIILAVPLSIFMWLMYWYINFSMNVVDTAPEIILSFVTMLFIAAAFCSTWFYMVKKCISFSQKEFILDQDKSNESIKLLKSIPQGFGRYFLYFVETCLLFLGITLIMSFLIGLFSYPTAKEIYSILAEQGIPFSNSQEFHTILDSIPPDTILDLLHKLWIPSIKFIVIVVSIPVIFSFLMLLWIPEIIYTRKNPLIALFTSIKKVFSKFLKSIKLFVYTTIIQAILSAFSPIMIVHPILYMLFVIIYFYFIVYIVVLIFSYYEQEFYRHKKENS